MHSDKQKIKLGAALQREQQRQKVEELLQQVPELELMQRQIKEIEEKIQREDARQQRAQRYERRMKVKEEKQEDKTGKLKDLVVEANKPTGSSKPKEPKTRNPQGGKKKQEMIGEEFGEEEEDKEKTEETMRKRKVVGCINLQEAAEFQNFVKDKMEELVEEMRGEKNLVSPVQKLIRSLKLQYDKVHLFENNGAVNTEDIVNTIHDTKGIAWRKSLEGKEIVDAEEYNMIIEMCMESHLFQEGNLHLNLDDTVFGQETDEIKEKIMQKCASLFENVEKAHHVNLAVAKDLKDLANMIKEPYVFSRVAQAATQLLVACYTPRIDTFIKQRQVTIEAKQDKLSQCKTIDELI